MNEAPHPSWCAPALCTAAVTGWGIRAGAHRSQPENVGVGTRMLAVELIEPAGPDPTPVVLLSVYGNDSGPPDVLAMSGDHAGVLGVVLQRHGRRLACHTGTD